MVKQISLIIVSWNVRENLEQNLERLFALPCERTFDVCVVDNGSIDGTCEMLRTRFPQVHLIQNDWDSGFAYACNQGLRAMTGEVCILLNPDMLVDQGALEATYDTLMNNPTIGVLGVRLNRADGTYIPGSVRRLPDFASQLSILLKIPKLFPSVLNHYLFTDFNPNISQDVPQLRGSYFALRTEMLEKIGYLDEGFHIWFEEVDYCERVLRAGYRLRWLATASAHDLIGTGFAKMKHLEKQRIFTTSMVRYFWKWRPKWQAAVLWILRPIGLLAALMADLVDKVRGKTPRL